MAGKYDVTYRCDGKACRCTIRKPCVIALLDAEPPIDEPDSCPWGHGYCALAEIRRVPAKGET